jgi:rod shape determining protein RodA
VINLALFKQYLKNFDFFLFAAVIILSVIGILLVASATSSFSGGGNSVIIQISATLLGIVLCCFLAFYDYETLASKYGYIITVNILLLIAVLIFGTGMEEAGGKSWIRYGKIGIQPAEIAKIGFILAFSEQLNRHRDNINSLKSVSLSFIHIAALVALIMAQPDFGTTMVFIAVFAAMLFTAKISYKYVAAALLAIPPVFAGLWFFVFKDFQKNRIIDCINPSMDTQYSGYQVTQSKTAIGAGKIFGQGLFKGILTQNNMLPAKHTDFIFAVAGEELGFVGALVILTLIVFIVVRCYIIAYNAKDSLGAFIGIGVGTMILVQSFENIGMTIGLTPVTGITLPFLSYGGSSMVTNYLAVGLALNVKVRHKKINFL